MVENVEIIFPVNSKPRLLTEREWNVLLPIVECEHMGINKKKNWVPYADFVLKYKRKTTSIRFYQINSEKRPLELAMKMYESCYKLSLDEIIAIQRLVNESIPNPACSKE